MTHLALDQAPHLMHDPASVISDFSPSPACHFPITSNTVKETISVPNPPVNFLKTPATLTYTALCNNANIAVQHLANVCSVLTYQSLAAMATTQTFMAAVCSSPNNSTDTFISITPHVSSSMALWTPANDSLQSRDHSKAGISAVGFLLPVSSNRFRSTLPASSRCHSGDRPNSSLDPMGVG